jgi:hypothetical protein
MRRIYPGGLRMRLFGACLLAGGLLLPAAASYAEPAAPATGTVVGSVSCGPAESLPAASATIAVEGINLSTHAGETGRFTLQGVPTAQFLTIDALTDPQGSVVTSRYDVIVQPGEKLDVGNLELVACPPPAGPETAALDETKPSDFRDQP